MPLAKYRKKRDFESTPEPVTASVKSSDRMNFCVQKHDARHLHYDFRLEYRGILLSWAIPKGPSMDPHDKRLAVHVEDHPLDYQYFEGVIPKGNYGAGTVEIWDKGSYTLPGTDNRKDMEKNIAAGMKQGHLEIILEGEKLKGAFLLQKLKKDSDDNAWLLIKKNDEHVEERKSKTLENHGKKRIMPDFIKPMLATLVKEPFDDEEWLFEVKWDGFRAFAFLNQNKIELKSRNNLSLNSKFPIIIKDLQKIKEKVILDGEIVVLDPHGRSDFQLMQNYQEKGGALYYYVFDLLYLNGKSLRDLPLIERKELLKKIIDGSNVNQLRYSKHIIKDGKAFFHEAAKKHLEGIIGKKILSSYQSKRSNDWVKIKTQLRQEVVIGGFTEPRGSRKEMGALLVGIYDENHQLQYAGHVGGGFNAKTLKEIVSRLTPLIQEKSPFTLPPKPNAPVTWVKPKLICEVSFSEWTKDNHMRQPIFQGMREDKDPKSIIREIPDLVPKIKNQKKSAAKQEISLTNLEKIFWPKEHYTKGDLIEYYRTIAKTILPYLKERPIVLRRFPNGILGQDFHQKNIDFSLPDGITTCPVKQENRVDHFLLIDSLNSLLFAINLGSIDLHPFLSNIHHLDNPDYCVIDLDPHDIPFKYVIDVAIYYHEILQQLNVPHFCKTSGGKGLHILIPLKPVYSFDQSRQFAEIISLLVHQKFPKITSLERNPRQRPNKIYLDCLQNRTGQTIVAPYCIRPRPKALVSTPLEWEEVNQTLDPSTFTMQTIPARIKKKGDLFKNILKKRTNLQLVINKISKHQY